MFHPLRFCVALALAIASAAAHPTPAHADGPTPARPCPPAAAATPQPPAPATAPTTTTLAIPPPPPPVPWVPPLSLAPDVSLSPGPGRVPVRVRTRSGPPQVVSALLPRAGTFGPVALVPHRVCTTPCTLFTSPGRLSLQLGEDLLAHHADLIVPASGLAIDARAGNAVGYALGVGMTAVGSASGLIGLAFLLAAPLIVALGTSGSSLTPADAAVAGAIGTGIGIAFLVPGLALSTVFGPSIGSVRPLRHAHR